MSKLSVEDDSVSKSANSSPNVRRKLFRRFPKSPTSTNMRAYVNEALSELETDQDEKKLVDRLALPDITATIRRSSAAESGLSIAKSETCATGNQMQVQVEKLLDEFDDICKDAIDQLNKLKIVLKKTREHIKQRRRQFEEKVHHHPKHSVATTCSNGTVHADPSDENLYFNYSIVKTALDPLMLSLRCLCSQAQGVVGPLHNLHNIPWLSLTFSKKQPMAREKVLPLIQATAELLSKEDHEHAPDVTSAASRLNHSLNPLLCSSSFTTHPDSDREVYTLVIWGRSGMAWHTHGFPHTRFKCEFLGWTIFACKSTVNDPVNIEDPRAFLQLLDGILRDAMASAGKDVLTGPLPSFVCKALENVAGGSWNCVVGRSGCQHAVSISDISVAGNLVKLEQGGLEFMIWQN